jgi:hypothetical protein
VACADPQDRNKIVIALEDLIRELAGAQANQIRERAQAIADLNDGVRNVSQLRMEVDAQVGDIDADVVELKADVEIKRLRLEHHDHTCGAH